MGIMGIMAKMANPFIDDEIVAASMCISDDSPDPEDVLHEESVSEQVEFGLVLPNGNTVWDNYHGYVFTTEADRQLMLAVLKQSAEDTGFDEEDFLANYEWTARKVVTTISRETIMPIDSSLAVGAPEPEVEPEVEEGELM